MCEREREYGIARNTDLVRGQNLLKMLSLDHIFHGILAKYHNRQQQLITKKLKQVTKMELSAISRTEIMCEQTEAITYQFIAICSKKNSQLIFRARKRNNN